MRNLKDYFVKIKYYYKQEEFSKAMIISVVILTAIIAVVAIGDSNNISLAFWTGQKETVNQLPQTGTDNTLDPKFRACIWKQNKIKSCEPSILAGIFNNTITISDQIEVVPIVDFDLGTGANGGTDNEASDNSWAFDDSSDETWGSGSFGARPSDWHEEGNNAPGSRIIFDGSKENPFAPDSLGDATQSLEKFTIKGNEAVTFYINVIPKANAANVHLKMRLGTGSWSYGGEGTEEHGALVSNEEPPYLNYLEIDTTGNEWVKVELKVDGQSIGSEAGPVTIKVQASGVALEYILLDDITWGGSSSSTPPLTDDEITERVNDPSVKWKALLYGIGGVNYFRGLESTGNTNVPGTVAFDYANGGVWGNRMEYSSRIDLAKKFPGPFMMSLTSSVTTAEGDTTSEDINLTLLVDKLGSHLGSLYVDDTEYLQGFHYTDNSPMVGVPAQFISKGYSTGNSPGVSVDLPSETTPDDYFEGFSDFVEYLKSIIGGDNLTLFFSGDCSELDNVESPYMSNTPYAMGSLIEEHPEDTLPNKEYLTNAGEVYSYDNTEGLCNEYLETGDDPFVVEGTEKEDFFDIANKPKCSQCEFDRFTTSTNGNIICTNGGIGRVLSGIGELDNAYGSPDPDYVDYYRRNFPEWGDDFACKLDNVIEGTFVRDFNDDGSVDVLLQDNGKPIPDKELAYWNEETRPGPDGVRPWCWLKYTKEVSLSKQATINMTIKGAEIPAAAGSIFHVLRKMTSKLPNAAEKQICLTQNIGTVVQSKLGILDTRQCGYFREITGNRVTAYYTLEQLIAKGDLPFNQGSEAQMCSPEKRIEPACDGKSFPAIGQYALTSIPESPVQGSGYAYVYYTFPFMGNIPALEQAFSKMSQNIKPTQTTEEQMDYIKDLLPTFNARLCEPGEMNIAVKWLISLGYITEDDAIRMNLYHKVN